MSRTGDRLADVVELMVDGREDVRVDERRLQRGSLFEVSVAPEDRGRVIGRQGRTVQALRSLLEAAAGAPGERHDLEILDD